MYEKEEDAISRAKLVVEHEDDYHVLHVSSCELNEAMLDVTEEYKIKNT